MFLRLRVFNGFSLAGPTVQEGGYLLHAGKGLNLPYLPTPQVPYSLVPIPQRKPLV